MKHIFYLFVFLPLFTGAQIITTIAGNGTHGFSGDGGPATSAQLYNPANIAFDGKGNIYIADQVNYRIRKVDTSGIITTIAGIGGGYSGDGGPATNARLLDPSGMAFDTISNLFFADAANCVIRKIDTAAIINTIAGDGGCGFAGDGLSATLAKFHDPCDVAFDHAGNLYIPDYYNDRVRKINSSGIITTIAGTGVNGYSGDGGPATVAQIHGPYGVTLDSMRNLYVADDYNHAIRKVDVFGIITTFAGTGVAGFSGDGGPATMAQLNQPTYTAIDVCGNMYISDFKNNRIRKVNPSGIITTIAGTGVAGYSGDGGLAIAAQLYEPVGIKTDTLMNIYFADVDNNVVRRISTANHPPSFTGGRTQYLTICTDTALVNINTLLGITDLDTLQTETWSVLKNPLHGLVVAAYSTTSTGGTITPVGLSYIPATGYIGRDTFKVKVSDCGHAADTTTIYVNVNPLLHPRIIGLNSFGLDSFECCTVVDSYSSYQWYEVGGPSYAVPGATSNSYTAGMGAWYVVVDSGGCLGISDTCWIYEGVNNINSPSHQIRIYPSPASTSLTISAKEDITTIVIVNLLGQTLFSQQYNSLHVQVDVADLPSGMYLIRINGTEVRKFVKE